MHPLSKKIIVLGAAFALAFGPLLVPAAIAQNNSPSEEDIFGNSSNDDVDGNPSEDHVMGNSKGSKDVGLMNPLKAKSLNELLVLVLDAIIQIGVVVVTLMIIYCGFLFVTAQGNPEAIGTARTALMWTIIGALILLGAKTIALVITETVKTL